MRNLAPRPTRVCGIAFALLLSAPTVVALDAVTVNADGTAFGTTVSGPNLLGTKTPVTLTINSTLTSADSGKFYILEYGASDLVITLPNASTVQGAIFGFTVPPHAPSMIGYRQHTVSAASGQNIDGRSSLILIHTNSLVVTSDGTRWISLSKKVDTDWVVPKNISATPQEIPITISALTTAPVKGVGSVDRLLWRRIGDSCAVRYEYVQSSGGTNGSGAYLISLPFSADTSKITTSTTSPSCAIGSIVTAPTFVGTVWLHDPSHWRAYVSWASGAGAFDSTHPGLAGAFSFSASMLYPVANW